MQCSILDLASVREGGTVAQALSDSVELAQHAESCGLARFWLAEHHGLPGVASAATAVLIGQVAAHTNRIRVGAGGIMLPNHAPLIVAEQFGTLEALFPGRIDLGLGRAPGSDGPTQRALRRPVDAAQSFVNDIQELQHWFAEPASELLLCAVPGAGANVPLWILGSSTYGAEVAAALGLPYAFASHFAPAQLTEALQRYRSGFVPSKQLQRPHVMLAINVVVADSEDEAQWLFSSLQQAFLRLRRGQPGRFPPPTRVYLTGVERELLSQVLSCSFVGTREQVREGLKSFVERHQPDELIMTIPVYERGARLKSLKDAAEAVLEL